MKQCLFSNGQIGRLAGWAPVLALALSLGVVQGCKQRQSEADLLGSVHYDIDSVKPPEVTYHYGRYDYLTQNAQSGTVPERVLDAAGGISNKPSRRGFYVAAHPAYNERYASPMFSYGNAYHPGWSPPWLMKVTLKRECLEEGRYARKVWQLDRDPKFQTWAGRDRQSWFYKFCHMDAPLGPTNSEDYAKRLNDFDCADLLAAYFAEGEAGKGVDLIHDWFWPDENYWIVRRSSCFQSIQASPKDVLEAMAVVDYWLWAPYDTDYQRHQRAAVHKQEARDARQAGTHAFNIMLRALSLQDPWDLDLLQRIREEAAKSDLTWDTSGGTYQVRDALQATLEKAIACQQSGDTSTMRQQIAVYLTKSDTPQLGGNSPDGEFFQYRQDTDHNVNFVKFGLPKVKCGGPSGDVGPAIPDNQAVLDQFVGKTFFSTENRWLTFRQDGAAVYKGAIAAERTGNWNLEGNVITLDLHDGKPPMKFFMQGPCFLKFERPDNGALADYRCKP